MAKKNAAKKPVKKTAKKTVKKAASKRAVKKTVKKASARKPTAAKKTTTKKAVKKVAKKTVKKAAAKTTAQKKTVKKKVAAKKTTGKPATKGAARKTSKPATKKTDAKGAGARAATRGVRKKVAAEGAKAQEIDKPLAPPDNGGDFIEMAYGMYDGIEVCSDPKPFPKKSPYSARDLKMLRKKLEEERLRLRQILRGLDHQTLPTSEENSNVVTPGYSSHLAESASDNIDTETMLMLRRDEESALFQVESALERIESGVFGVCLACGDKIGVSRLRAVPEAHLCMKCKQVYDKKKYGRQ